MPVQEHKNSRPGLPRMALLLDIETGRPVAQVTEIKAALPGEAIIGMLNLYITEHGRPSLIVTKDEEAGCYIADFAQKVGIETRTDGNFPSVNNFLMSLMNEMGSGYLR
jgi:hypothetical protein